jgi:adenylylsulfate kinase
LGETVEGGFVLWLTGLPGSGKTTIASILGPRLKTSGLRVEMLDGDEVRKWLSPNEGFSREDRERHLRRVAHVAELLSRNGVVVICSFVSPYVSTRTYARETIGNFVEVYVKCSLEMCQKRDPKGLYKKASAGQMTNMTGVQDAYEPPPTPEIIVDTERAPPETCAGEILSKLQEFGYIPTVVGV